MYTNSVRKIMEKKDSLVRSIILYFSEKRLSKQKILS